MSPLSMASRPSPPHPPFALCSNTPKGHGEAGLPAGVTERPARNQRNPLGGCPNCARNARLRAEGLENPVRKATSAKGCRVSVIIRRAACNRSDKAKAAGVVCRLTRNKVSRRRADNPTARAVTAAFSGASIRASIRATACATRGSRRGSRLGSRVTGGAICGSEPGRGVVKKDAATCRAKAGPWREPIRCSIRSAAGAAPPAVKRLRSITHRSGTTSTSGWAAERSSRSSQCTVARWPAKSPARAKTQAAASIPPTAAKRPAIRDRSRISGAVATSDCRNPAITTKASAPSAADSGPDEGSSIPQVKGTARPSGETTRQRYASCPRCRLADRIGSSVEATSRIDDCGKTSKASVSGCCDAAKIDALFAISAS